MTVHYNNNPSFNHSFIKSKLRKPWKIDNRVGLTENKKNWIFRTQQAIWLANEKIFKPRMYLINTLEVYAAIIEKLIN